MGQLENEHGREPSGQIQKALQLNLDPLKYGTIAEIGAGQEVARFFFRAGGAAGTIAKSVSAYDMNISDAIYGEEKSKRYVSESRLVSMLNCEFETLFQNIRDSRPKDSTFFVYADTVAARGYKSNRDCHGWCGIRLQLYPGAEPSDIIVHVRMLDDENSQQQEALGMLGVNIIYGAYHHYRTPESMVESFVDNLSNRIEIDMIRLSGPYFHDVDNRLLSLHLVKAGITNAVLFNPDGESIQPSEALYKKSVLALRGSYRPPTLVNMDMVRCGTEQFLREPDVDPDRTITLAEITMAKLMTGNNIDTQDFLDRVDVLGRLGLHVLISNYGRFFRLRSYLSRSTTRTIGIVLGVDNILDIFNEAYYQELEGGILEAFGKLFPGTSKMYVYPKRSENGANLLTADNLQVPENLKHLYAHLRHNGFIKTIEEPDEAVLCHYSRSILEKLKFGDGPWREGVPEPVYKEIVERSLFGFSSR